MVPSAATASVPQLLHFPLDVDIWREGAGFNKWVWFRSWFGVGVYSRSSVFCDLNFLNENRTTNVTFVF